MLIFYSAFCYLHEGSSKQQKIEIVQNASYLFHVLKTLLDRMFPPMISALFSG